MRNLYSYLDRNNNTVFEKLEYLNWTIPDGFNDNLDAVILFLKRAPNLKLAHIDCKSNKNRIEYQKLFIKSYYQKGILVERDVYEQRQKEILGF